MQIGVEMQMRDVPPQGMCSLLEFKPSHGIARGNLQLPCLHQGGHMVEEVDGRCGTSASGSNNHHV